MKGRDLLGGLLLALYLGPGTREAGGLGSVHSLLR